METAPFSSLKEYERMVDYFLNADDSFLNGMGVARSLLPTRETWLQDLWADHQLPDHQKDRLYVGWFYNGEQIGHSSVNKIDHVHSFRGCWLHRLVRSVNCSSHSQVLERRYRFTYCSKAIEPGTVLYRVIKSKPSFKRTRFGAGFLAHGSLQSAFSRSRSK